MNLNDSIREMVRRDMLRAPKQLPDYRPGKDIPDGTEIAIRCLVSIEMWQQVYAKNPVLENDTDTYVILRCRMRYHKGKLAWELLGWCVITNEDAAMSEEILGPWGIGTVRWLDGAA